ncbi:hypothetical protein RUM43_007870 [Polyplax serrata]|uniref:Uncharacterized protein n=1 Tax=Polyplax serrata TaxID=468196 RepID=A0AAN8PNC0_POLSC
MITPAPPNSTNLYFDIRSQFWFGCKLTPAASHKSTTQPKSPPLIFAWMPCGYRSHDCNSQPTGPITKPETVEDLFVMDFDPSYRGGHRLVPLVGTNLPSTCPLTP